MNIRTAREADFIDCITIARQAWPEFKEREAIYHLLCKFFTDTCFIAEQNGQVRGFLLGFISQVDRREAYIHLIIVEPTAQRRGLARNLYEQFFKTVRRLGARWVRLTVAPDNKTSLAFHKTMGFEPSLGSDIIQLGEVSAAKDYNGPGNSMVPLILHL